MTRKSRLLPTLVFSIAAALGVYLAHAGTASAEKCNPKVPSTCVGGPTGPEPTCGVEGKPCCEEPLEGTWYCTDPDLRCGPSPTNNLNYICEIQ